MIRRHPVTALLAVLTLAPHLVFAQAADTSAPPPVKRAADDTPKADEPIELSPFRVDSSRDSGYRATNSISGTRLNTAIKDIPMPIEVITADFMKDIGATNLRDALTYSAGIVTDSQNDFANPDIITHPSDSTAGVTGSPSQTAIKVRGFITTEALRNGFRRASPSDTINIERVEVVRGPSALLYGIGNFGGVVNYITKRPLPKSSDTVSFSAGSWGYLRGDIDATAPIGDSAGYRLTGAWMRSDDWTEFKSSDQKFISPVFEFRPTKTTDVVVDFEKFDAEYDGIGFQGIRSTVKGLAASRKFDDFLPTPGHDRKTFRWSGPDTYRKENDTNLEGEVTQQVGENLTLLGGAQYTRNKFDTRDVRAVIEVFGATPAYVDPSLVRVISFYPVGLNPRLNRNADLGVSWSDEEDVITTEQARFEGNYHLKLGSTGHNFLFGYSTQSRTSSYLLNGIAPNRDDLFGHRAVDDLSYFRYSAANLSHQQDNDIKAWDSGAYFVYQGKFFNDHLQIVGGLRYDRSDARTIFRDLVTGKFSSVVNSVTGEPVTKTSPQAGASFAITKELSVYGLYATGLVPNYDKTDGNGTPFVPSTAKSAEVGVKIDLLQGKISGTISAYKIKRSDTPYYVYWAPNNTRHIFDPTKPISWEVNGQVLYENNPADLAAIQAASAGQYSPNSTNIPDVSYGYGAGNNPSLDQGAYTPVDDESKGVDLQLIFSPIDNWQTVFTYAHVNRKLTNGPAFVKYLYGYDPYALWYVNSESPVDKYGGGGLQNYSNPQDTSTYNRSFGRGLSADDTPPDTFTVWTHYKFTQEPLKGFALGFGAKYESARDYLAGGLTTDGGFVKPTSGNLFLFSPSRPKTIVDGLVSYTTMLARHEWVFSVNCFNLLDNQKQYGSVYQAPRSFHARAQVSF